MKERPIIFSGTSVRAILEARKTQTRRIVKPQPFGGDSIVDNRKYGHGFVIGRLRDSENAWRELPCPYKPGDRLWVRETWKPHSIGIRAPSPAIYKADYEPSEGPGPWRNSIHMPRWASRITLEVTGVRVQRVQEISEEDAIAEGCRAEPDGMDGPPGEFTAKLGFAMRWDHINVKRGFGWDANPWVWVVEFRVGTPAKGGIQ